MNNYNSIKLSIDPDWNAIKSIREKISDLLKARDKDLVDDTLMVVSELMENAVKYGVLSNAKIEFGLEDKKDHIIIHVRNGVQQEGEIKELMRIINKINDTSNPAGLYMDRMRELKEEVNPNKAKLGLYRIASEGGFFLSYEYHDGWLTITAEKKIEKRSC